MVRWSLKPVLIAGILVVFCGCNTPESVSRFCGSANATLSSAEPIFRDLYGSCMREVDLRNGIGTFKTSSTNDSCGGIREQAEGAVAAVGFLSEYYNALNALAAVGTAKTGSDASTLSSAAMRAFGTAPSAQTAVASMVQFLTSGAAGGFQRKSLDRDLAEASRNIGTVIDALISILRVNYLGEGQGLSQESQKLATHYKEFALAHNDGETLLSLDDRWHADEQAILAKRASAEALIGSLLVLKNGTADLAANAHTRKLKELPGLLDPYVAQLQSLIPQIQKAY